MGEDIYRPPAGDDEAGLNPQGSRRDYRGGFSVFLILSGVLAVIILVVASGFFMIKNPVKGKPGNNNKTGKMILCIDNMKDIAVKMELYAADNGGFYPDTFEQLTPSYIDAIPTCPSAERDTYSATYTVSHESHEYTFFCNGENHMAETGKRGDYPQYSSCNGFSRWSGDVFVYGSNPRKTPENPNATYKEPPVTPWKMPAFP